MAAAAATPGAAPRRRLAHLDRRRAGSRGRAPARHHEPRRGRCTSGRRHPSRSGFSGSWRAARVALAGLQPHRHIARAPSRPSSRRAVARLGSGRGRAGRARRHELARPSRVLRRAAGGVDEADRGDERASRAGGDACAEAHEATLLVGHRSLPARAELLLEGRRVLVVRSSKSRSPVRFRMRASTEPVAQAPPRPPARLRDPSHAGQPRVPRGAHRLAAPAPVPRPHAQAPAGAADRRVAG
jgi:hypothetical protein